MDSSTKLSTSKVTVEYHDPAGVFPLLSAQLQARLPLRNLHWKTASRPVRSIDSLHVELESDQSSRDSVARPSTSGSQDSVSSQGGHRNSHTFDGHADRGSHGLQPFRPAQKRRHQIPGLRRTPYLKLFLFRCDDPDTYKTTARQQIREWIRTNTNTSSSHDSGKRASAQENHDAFEWLIVHVVVPNTTAAAQPRFSGSLSSSTGTAKDRSNKTKWPGGKSTTIFEKIRSDFNSSSSHALDRVAQVRIQNEDLPADRQFPASTTAPAAWPETPSERGNAWLDVVAKIKSLILESFDLRVSQYEDDIHEKDAQRSLPGWNFCTFFVLKEGLARSFEGVGLVEDALVIYDELALGLDTVIRDKAENVNDVSSTALLQSTKEIGDFFKEVSDLRKIQPALESLLRRPISEHNKPYREMILQNNISVFDFQCYIFARQLSLLLRLGKPTFEQRQSDRSTPDNRRLSYDDAAEKRRSLETDGEGDLGALAEICRRGLIFSTTTARVLQDDLTSNTKDGPSPAVGHFVTSWTVAVAEQILAETVSSALDARGTNQGRPSPLKNPRTRSYNNATDGSGSNVDRPARTSSLLHRPKSTISPPYNQDSGEVIFDRLTRLSGERTRPGEAPKYGLVELAGHRAELTMLERRLLELLGDAQHWDVGWSSIEKAVSRPNQDLETVSLASVGSASKSENLNDDEPSQSESDPLRGLCHPKLVAAVSSIEAFRKAVETLDGDAIAHYLAAGQTRSAEDIYADLAILKYQSGDFASAGKIFERITPMFGSTRWNLVEVAMLRLQADCLKALNRKDEYMRVLLIILQKAAATKRDTAADKVRKSLAAKKNSRSSWLDDSDVQAGDILQTLISYSSELPYDVSVPMATYFSDIQVDTYIGHYDDRDGFTLTVSFRHLLDDAFTADMVQLKLVGTTNEQKRDILLQSKEPVRIEKDLVKCTLHTNVTTYGSFLVEKIAIRANKILFLHEPLVKPEAPGPLAPSSNAPSEALEHMKMTRILCYPRSTAFEAKLGLSRSIHISKTHCIEMRCNVGSNSIDRLEIRLRAASAGLRIRTSEATADSDEVSLPKAEKAQPGVIVAGSLKASTSFQLLIPYDVETTIPEILVRIDAEYTVSGDAFQFFDHAKIPIDLPLDVNVQDSFKPFALFSTFNIRTPTHRPLRLLQGRLEPSKAHSVEGPLGGPWPRIVFPESAMSLHFIVKQKDTGKPNVKDPLTLALDYQFFEEQIEALAERAFSEEVQKSSFAALRRLLIPSFIAKLMYHTEIGDWTQMAYRDEVTIPSLEAFAWDDVLEALPPPQRPGLHQWLEQWHTAHTKILLGNIHDLDDLKNIADLSTSIEPSDVSHITRRITISVTIPTIQLIPTASLTIRDYERKYLPTDEPWPVGHAKTATLTISHTRSWGDPAQLQALTGISKQDDPVKFTYEIDANPDLWLVGGPKRGIFSQREGKEHSFSLNLLLVPLRRGDWGVPTVDVHPVSPKKAAQSQKVDGRNLSPESSGAGRAQSAERSVGEQDGEEISCETYYEDQFQRVLVVPAVKSTTVGLYRGGDRGTVLLSSTQKLVEETA